MVKNLLLSLCLVLLLPACAPPAAIFVPTFTAVQPTPTAPPAPTHTLVKPTPTRELTATRQPTLTSAPTDTSEPTATRQPAGTRTPTPSCYANFIPLGFNADGSHLLGIRTINEQTGTWLQTLDLKTQSARTILRIEQVVSAWALAPDLRSMAWALPDFSIQQVSLSNGSVLATYPGHTQMVNALVFSPDGSRLYSASNDRSVIAWNTADQQVIQRFEPPGIDFPSEVLGLGISPDGKLLVTIPFDGNPKSWETDTFTQVGEYPGAIMGAYSSSTALFSPDGQYLLIMLAGGPGTAALWRVADGQKLWSGGFMTDAAFSPDARLFAHIELDFDNRPNTIVIRTIDAQTVLQTINRESELGVWKMFFTPDSSQLVASTGANMSFYDVDDGKLVDTYQVVCP